MAIQAHITAASWHNDQIARDLLGGLATNDLYVRRTQQIVGPDRIEFSGECVERLGNVRERLIAQAFGCSFGEAYDTGRVDEFFAFYDDQPTVQDVIEAHFGVPLSHCNPWDMTMATAQWRAYVGATLVREAA